MRHCPPRLVCLFSVMALAGTTSVMANNETSTPPPSLPGLLSSFSGSKILLIGILDSDLTIITKDASPLVYDVPVAKFVDGKFDLYGLAPVQLSSKWPTLSSNANFTSKVLSNQLHLSISIKLDSEKLVFPFNSYPDPPRNVLETVTFSVNSPSASYQKYGIDDGFLFLRAHFISSSEQNVFFDLVVDPGKSHQLIKYVYQASGFNLTSAPYMCKQAGSNGTKMIVFKDYLTGCTNLDWDIQNGGFVNQNRFHLFSHDTVYIFEYTGAGGADPAGVPVTVVKLSDFFVSVTPTTTTTKFVSASTGKAGASTGTIIALVCVLLAVLVIIIAVVVWCKCNKKGPRPNDLEMSQSSKCPAGQSQAQSSQFQKQSTSAQANPSGQVPTDAKGLGSSKAKQMRSSRTPSAKNKVKLSAKVKLAKFGKQSKATSLKGTK